MVTVAGEMQRARHDDAAADRRRDHQPKVHTAIKHRAGLSRRLRWCYVLDASARGRRGLRPDVRGRRSDAFPSPKTAGRLRQAVRIAQFANEAASRTTLATLEEARANAFVAAPDGEARPPARRSFLGTCISSRIGISRDLRRGYIDWTPFFRAAGNWSGNYPDDPRPTRWSARAATVAVGGCAGDADTVIAGGGLARPPSGVASAYGHAGASGDDIVHPILPDEKQDGG